MLTDPVTGARRWLRVAVSRRPWFVFAWFVFAWFVSAWFVSAWFGFIGARTLGRVVMQIPARHGRMPFVKVVPWQCEPSKPRDVRSVLIANRVG